MDTYVSILKSYAENQRICGPPHAVQVAKAKLDQWMNAHNKEDVGSFYDDYYFGVHYVLRLYWSRIRCYQELLQDTSSNSDITDVIKSSNTVYSFGCGPGPEIAAYICYLRNNLGDTSRRLTFVAVDRVQYWSEYISQMSFLDPYSTVTFQNYELNRSTLSSVPQADVCIMSYPHAIGFDAVWPLLKQKFRLVLVIDQGKRALHKTVRAQGYSVRSFLCREEKYYFYHVTKPLLCARNQHSVMSWDDVCRATIQKVLPCSHSREIKCYENGNSIICTASVQKKCKAGLHWRTAICGDSTFHRCEQQITKMFPCWHNNEMRCFEADENRNCVVKRKCKAGIHETKTTCGQVNLPVCRESISKKLQCSHTISVYCSQPIGSYKCRSLVYKQCQNGIHEYREECSETKRLTKQCNDNIKIRFLCGHMIETPCNKVCLTIPVVNKAADFPVTMLRNPLSPIGRDGDVKQTCQKQCGQLRSCGHLCKATCNQCYLGRLHSQCFAQCERLMQCGHRCAEKCHLRSRCLGNCERGCLRNKLRKMFHIKPTSWNPHRRLWRSLRATLRTQQVYKQVWPHLKPLFVVMCRFRISDRLLGLSEDLHRFISELMNLYTIVSLDCPFKDNFFWDFIVDFLTKFNVTSDNFDRKDLPTIIKELQSLSVAFHVTQNVDFDDERKLSKIFTLLQRQ